MSKIIDRDLMIAAYNEVRQDVSDTNWCCLKYDDGDNLTLESQGVEFEELKSKFRVSQQGHMTVSHILSTLTVYKMSNTPMATAIGSTLSLRDIAVTYRLGKKRVNGKPRDIIVKFNSRRDRDKFYKNRVLLKTNGYEGKYVNEDLTQYRSGVLYEARQLVRQKKIIGAWSTNCKLLIKVTKDKKTSIHTVTCKRDLQPFLSYSIE